MKLHIPRPPRLPRIAALASIVLSAACTTPPLKPPAAPLAPPAAIKTEGVPALSRAQLDASRRYGDIAGHGFIDWHPLRREMLVAHRPLGASTTQLFRLRSPLGTLEPLTEGREPVSGARWEPRDGKYIVFARGTGGDEAYQLYRLDPETRVATAFTAAGQKHALLAWVKSRALAVVRSEPLDRTAAGGRRNEVVTTLSITDPMNPTDTRVLAELPGGGWEDAEVSPDDRQLAITQYISATESAVWLIDIASGQRRRVLPAEGQPLTASHGVNAWSADGRALYIDSDRAGEFRELMRHDLATGSLTRLSADTPWDAGGASVSADGKQLAYQANVDGREELRLLDTATGTPRTLPRVPPGSVTRSGFHRSTSDLAVVVNSTQGPGQIHSLDVNTGALTTWTQPVGVEGLELASLPEQQIVRWKSFDGRTISGILSLPPARFGGKRPVLMLVHGGPEGQSKLGWQGRWNYLVQDLGVAVFQPNVRGSTGYGKTFLSLDNGRLREDSVKDMGTAIDWMATQPGLDASRVIVVGGSYGGYMALAASTVLANRIAGAASAVGISNWVTFLQNTESYRRDLRRVEYGDERDPAMRAFLESISPLNHVAKINKPLLVTQGKNDPRVPWTESEQIVRSLQARNSPVWYLLADNEGHGFARRENADFYFATLLRFVELTLKP